MINVNCRRTEFHKIIMGRQDESIALKGRLKLGEPMFKHTSWRVGGPADRFFIPHDLADLKLFLAQVDEDETLTWIGLGSNLLVRDGGIRGTVIATKNMDDNIKMVSPTEIEVGAGISCAQIARYSVRTRLAGAEFLVGIPGTFGGALAMNAGAFGAETWDIVKATTSINRKGDVITRDKSEFKVAYRSITRPQGEWFISAVLSLEEDLDNTGESRLKDLLYRRSEAQPIGQASCGSVFRNPETGEPAARLIDSCGLKGFCIGEACVSTKHANFIINRGNASARDIESLILHIQDTVYQEYKISLIPEVQILGERV